MGVERYSQAVEANMQKLSRSFNERDRRRYAAVEAEKIGHGGTAYIAELLGIDPKTIRQGKQELDAEGELDTDRVRKKGRDANAIFAVVRR